MRAIYRGFCQAKEQTLHRLVAGMTFNNMFTPVPWLVALLEADRALLGDDWFAYGYSANAQAIDAILRDRHEQGIPRRRFTAEEIFVPYLPDS